MIQSVIFDVDGTLIDSVDLHAHAWQDVFREFGKEIPFEDVRFQIGKGGDQLMPVFLTKLEVAERGEAITERRGAIFKEKYLSQVTGFPQVRELFERLLADGKRIALASSANADELETYKRIARVADLIQAETSSDDVAKSKPHPDIFAAALAKLDHPAVEETLVVGDTPYDIQAASKLRLGTIAVLCGGFPEDTLREAIAIFRDPADLLTRYEDSPLFSASPRSVLLGRSTH